MIGIAFADIGILASCQLGFDIGRSGAHFSNADARLIARCSSFLSRPDALFQGLVFKLQVQLDYISLFVNIHDLTDPIGRLIPFKSFHPLSLVKVSLLLISLLLTPLPLQGLLGGRQRDFIQLDQTLLMLQSRLSSLS